MPVHDRRYRTWAGTRRSPRGRFWILTRHSMSMVFTSRFATLLFGLACLVPLGFGLFIYSVHNVDLLTSLNAQPIPPEMVGPILFYAFLVAQTSLGFLLTAFIAPTLVAPDLAHNGLSLVLSRPFSRGEYVLGKLLVLLALLSAVTWIPGLLLVLLQGSLAGWSWVQTNSHLAWAIFAGSWLWILLVSLLALALSVVLRWRPVATGAVFAIFIVGEGFGHAVADVAETRWGHLVSLKTLVTTVWADLFGPSRAIRAMLPDELLPVAACWIALSVAMGLSLWLLMRRVRPVEVSR